MKILVHPKDEQPLELHQLEGINVVVPTLPEEQILHVARKQTVFQIARRAAAVRGQTTSKAYVRNMLMRGRK